MGSICFKQSSNYKNQQVNIIRPRSSFLNSSLEERQVRRTEKNKPNILELRKGSAFIEEASTAKIREKSKTETERKIIMICLNKHFILKNLDPDTKEYILQQMTFYKIGARETIFEQGQPAKSFYVVCSGRLEVIVNGVRKDTLKQGQGFGELALLDDSPRTATIRTIEKSTLWGLDRDTFKTALKRINEQNLGENMGFINSVSLLSMLTSEQKQLLVSSMTPQYWNAGEKIVKEGDVGELFYIIKDGTVLCTERGREVRFMGKGDYFGELALLYNSTRTATITCQTDVKVVSIGREHFIEVLGNNLEQVIYRNTQRIIIDRSPTLRALSKDQIESTLDSMEIETYRDSESVIPENTLKNAYIYMVLKGSLKSSQKVYGVFSCVGDDSFSSSEMHQGEFVASGDTHISRISREDFENAIGGTYAQISSFNEVLSIFRQIQLLQGLPLEKVRELMKLMSTQEFPDKTVIVEQGSLGSSFYIVQSGTVEILKDDTVIRTISTFDYFGERAVLCGDKRTASVMSKGSVSCWVLKRKDFHRVIDEGIVKQLRKRMELQDDTIQLSDLVPVKQLGKGMFGHVYLTVHKQKKTLYSLKTVSRAKIIAYELYENILLERKILLQLDHFMIMKLVKTFKDQTRLYLLMEYVQGMDLFDVLRILNLVNEKDARFYTGCLILIIEYLHERNIVYRDLNPENVMIDEEGYPKLIDFGSAKIINSRTYTTIGTPHYMAPEVILGSGYTLSVDWWSIGIMLYEFLYGALPFGDDEDDPQLVYEKILEHNLFYPSYSDPMSPVRPLIEQLLSKNNNSRSTKLKAHRWFNNFNWKALFSKEAKPPYVPKIDNLSEMVNQALIDKVDLGEEIQRKEGNMDDEIKRRYRPPPPDWDAEF